MILATDDFAFIRHFLRAQSGMMLGTGKEYLVEARLKPVAQQAGLASLQDLITHLRQRASTVLCLQVVEALLTNETQFFRDVHPFETLRTSILPDLIDKRSAERQLSLWCAAAASGQEPYSVALLLAEHFPQFAQWNVRCLASDISSVLLERAQRGCYSQLEVNRGLPVPVLRKYFHKNGREWQLSEHIRQRVTFRHMNLIQPWPHLPPMDIIFMRNVLIYFDEDTKKPILGKIRQLLKPDGYLLLGSSETLRHHNTAFMKRQFDRTVYYQRVS